MFALVDGNNFYVACERVFRPELKQRPVVVLSNNDGCAIARSPEAKALGVAMGQPYYQLRGLEQQAGLICLSANFELYGDMSDRMMSLAAGLGPQQEIYSIDESFIGGLQGVADLTARAHAVRERIGRWIGIPVCIGLAPTKTLAKLANHVAKAAEYTPQVDATAKLAKVCNWSELSNACQQRLLTQTPVEGVWGIGRRLGARLRGWGVHTAWDLACMPVASVRQAFGVTLERTVRELQGVSCMALEDAPLPPHQIACTRSFGLPVTEWSDLCEAISVFTSQAAEKLRRKGLQANVMLVFAHSSPFRPGPRFHRSVTVPLPAGSADTGVLIAAALAAAERIYAPGVVLSKAGVILLELQTTQMEQASLWESEGGRAQASERLMQAMDRINTKHGANTVRIGSCGLSSAPAAAWQMRQNHRSPRYTTCVDQLPVANA